MSVPHGHWKTTTFIGGLRLSGMTAPMMLDSPMTGEWFAAYARKVLAPTLSPGDVVILDNLPAHKSAEAREAVEAVGARLLFLPPYSPDFNPIENIFAKMKAWIRRAAPRTLHALQDAVCGAIDDVCHRQAVAYFAAAPPREPRPHPPAAPSARRYAGAGRILRARHHVAAHDVARRHHDAQAVAVRDRPTPDTRAVTQRY
ncbi:IS630 family transposase [Gluconacetobacter asukensis]|uniref:IS630 family transposase n=2 Tax=Gluconacetobacter asukensis TaxID=1017181 RepID=A0A7W4J3Y5_9PROT|nr:IS630 family transposase [Gluconacetobacter asukensis]